MVRLEAGRLHLHSIRRSLVLRRYMGGSIGGFYLVILKRWFLYVDWIPGRRKR